MNSDPQQWFWDWVENNIADALGYPVFSIGQEVLFKRFNQIVLAEVESYVISTDSNGDLDIQYRLWIDNDAWDDACDHQDLLKLNPIANNLPRSRRYHDRQNPTDCNCSRD